ncbi:MAG: metal transporter substrate-binding protein [Rhodospirillales bacterium]|jgi:D-methionine transport system substrate-binding protein|nr:metal transporter substrate-binding protein [Rhodospirillales bacterium]
MFTRRTSVGAAALLPTLGLAIPANAQDIGSAARPLRIGATAGPHAQVLEIAAWSGLALRSVEFQDYIQPNAALAAGDLDANSYQHLPFPTSRCATGGCRWWPLGAR